MPFQLINTAVLGAIETLVNKTRALDPASGKRLQALDGKVVEVRCTSPAFSLFFAVYHHDIRLFPSHEGHVDTSITGSAAALMTLLTAPDRKRVFYRKDIEISGDLEVVRKLQAIMEDMELDWEYQLSKIAGDIPTQMLRDGLDSFSRLLGKNRDSLVRDIDEYLHQESRMFPHAGEIEDFYRSLTRLSIRLDRCTARVNRIEAALDARPSNMNIPT